jgi:putative ABC transport system substrate-binding protein
MQRRRFITVVGGAALAWPFGVRAQQPTPPVIGFVNAASRQGYARPLSAFLKGLSEAGYVDGRNVAIEYRWAEDDGSRLPGLIAELVQRRVSALVATTTQAALAAKAATTTIPIVFETASDPIRLGLVASLSHPGGNVTGITQTNVEIAPKRLELLRELIPAASVMALLVNPANPTLADANTKELQAAARSLALELHVLHASAEHEFDAAFAKLVQLRAAGLVIGSDPFFTGRSERLAALAVRHAVPAVYAWREFAAAGGLMSYGAAITDSYRLVGTYTGRILKGEKPADLPVQQINKVELIINLKAARALSLTVPLSLLGRADEVIE